MIDINHLFHGDGSCVGHYSKRFDKDGGLLHSELIEERFIDYVPESDIVKMHYAEVYANETKGHYSALKLYERARD